TGTIVETLTFVVVVGPTGLRHAASSATTETSVRTRARLNITRSAPPASRLGRHSAMRGDSRSGQCEDGCFGRTGAVRETAGRAYARAVAIQTRLSKGRREGVAASGKWAYAVPAVKPSNSLTERMLWSAPTGCHRPATA